MRILIACEESQTVCKAFRAKGHEAFSCDILPCSGGHPEWHLHGDVLTVLEQKWDMMIAHPPCRFLALCQAWRETKPAGAWRKPEREKATRFATALWEAPIHRICLENPKSRLTTLMAPKNQTIHPWQHGHGEQKTTWLWLKNLPPLVPTCVVAGRKQRIWKMSPGPERSRLRSITYQGIADAMATQWGSL